MKRSSFALLVLLLPACGGGGGGSTTPPSGIPGFTTYTVGGAVSGLSGSGLILTNNGIDDLTINTSSGFTFATAFPSGFPYDVAVKTQPSSPAQRCLVANGTGTLNGANVTNVQVTCASTIGGTVSGLVGTVLLRDNGGDDLSLSSNGPFTFATGIATGNTYSVTASNPNQQCTVTNGTGTANGNVSNVQVVCRNTIGGLVSGLVGTVVLQNNGGDNLSISALGPFTFPTALDTSNNTFSVTVFAQPVNQTCLVTAHQSGVAFGNVTDIQVSCVNGQWTWMSGVPIGNQIGVYGTKGTAAAANVPGSRYSAVSWTDATNGNLWLFGGFGYDSVPPTISLGRLNDLWKYNVSAGQWTWVSGANLMDQNGVYGTKGIPAAANVPGSREEAINWKDASGNLWLFGGLGLGISGGIPGNTTEMNDLWRYDVGTGQWTWMSGANVGQQPGVYGTKGTPAAANVPGSRQKSVSWIDSAGNLWLFGGFGWSGVNLGQLNDLWMYNTTTNRWTWVSGTSATSQGGVYGTQGVPAAANVPGGRESAVSWIDGSGNLWLFGGSGWITTGGSTATLNDLWKYSPGTNQWTWVSGANAALQSGTYGTLGVAANNNVPGARASAVSWIDAGNNLWLFGGNSGGTMFNDVWKFDGSQWTWMSGSNSPNQLGVYGTLGVAGAGIPGARQMSVSWYDASGNMWLFGGYDGSHRNDLWRYK
jgi:galactose oxidase-like protein